MKKQILMALSLTLLLFSIVSGCKTKKKLVQKSSVNTALEKENSDSARLVKIESSHSQSTDSTKKSETTKETATSKRTYEIHITLDSNKRSLMDTTGNFDIRKLINAGLQNASSLIVKVEDQQSQTKESSRRKQSHRSSSMGKIKNTDSTAAGKSKEKSKAALKSRNVDVQSDSTVAKNSGSAWHLMGIAAIILGGSLVYWYNRRKIK